MKNILLTFVMYILCIHIIAAAENNNYGNVYVNFKKAIPDYTIVVDIPNYPAIAGNDIKVKISGIKAPANFTDQQKLVKKLNDILSGSNKNIELKSLKRGETFSIIADVYCNGVNIANTLVEDKLAVSSSNNTEAQPMADNSQNSNIKKKKKLPVERVYNRVRDRWESRYDAVQSID